MSGERDVATAEGLGDARLGTSLNLGVFRLGEGLLREVSRRRLLALKHIVDDIG